MMTFTEYQQKFPTGQKFCLVSISPDQRHLAFDVDFTDPSVELDPRISFTRVGPACYTDSSGVLQEAASGEIRAYDKADHDPDTLECLGLLAEESRTNSVRNNTMVGAVVGALGGGGQLPANWSVVAPGGIAVAIAAIEVEKGVECIDIHISGTPSVSTFVNIVPDSLVVGLSGQAWSGSFFTKLVAGSFANTVPIIEIREASAAQAFLTNTTQTLAIGTALKRYFLSRTLTNASTAYVSVREIFQVTAGFAVDFTIRIGLPQLERGTKASSVIRTYGSAEMRHADVPVMTGDDFSSWFNPEEGTFVTHQVRPASAIPDGNILQVDDGTNNNRYSIGTGASGAVLNPFVVTGGVSQVTLTQGSGTGLGSQSLAVAYKADDFLAVTEGGTAVTDSSGTLPVVDTLRIGHIVSGGSYWNGHIKRISYYDVALSLEQVELLLAGAPPYAPIRLSGTGYNTLPTDSTLPNTTFRALIAKGGIPRMSRGLRDMLGGSVVNSWGPVSLVSTEYKDGVDLSSSEHTGKKVEILLTGPADVVHYEDATKALVGYIVRKSGTVGRGLTLHLADRGRLLSKSIDIARYDADEESSYFPETNDGKIKPIVLGKCNNVPAMLIDKDLDKYQVSDPRWPIDDIKTVYVNGMSVSFTKDLANNAFTLPAPANSNETVTAEVWGVAESSVLLSTHAQIIKWVLKTFSPFSTDAEIDISGLPSGDAGYCINSEETIDTVLDELTRSCLSCYFVTPEDKVKVRQISLPVSGGPKFGRTKFLEEVVWNEVEDIYHTVPYTYDNNWAELSTLADAIADQDFEIWLKSESRENKVVNTTTQGDYETSSVAPVLKTLFIDKADAEAVATLAQEIFGTLRYRATLRIPYYSPPLAFLDSVELLEAGPVTGDCLVTSVEEDFTGATFTMKLEVFK